MSRQPWQREQLLVAFAFYCETPFGKLHAGNPDIIALAGRLGRTPSALAMKLCNFASLDPQMAARGIRGLGAASKADRDLWEEFGRDPEGVAVLSQQALLELTGEPTTEPDLAPPDTPSETHAQRRVRLVQRFFRRTVIASYDMRCAVCQLALPALLNASHIIPWHVDASRRADPTNGLSLCALHDRAFDRGLIAVDDGYRVLISPSLPEAGDCRLQTVGFAEVEGTPLHLPRRFAPDPVALEYHRRWVFRQADDQ